MTTFFNKKRRILKIPNYGANAVTGWSYIFPPCSSHLHSPLSRHSWPIRCCSSLLSAPPSRSSSSSKCSKTSCALPTGKPPKTRWSGRSPRSRSASTYVIRRNRHGKRVRWVAVVIVWKVLAPQNQRVSTRTLQWSLGVSDVLFKIRTVVGAKIFSEWEAKVMKLILPPRN